MNSDYTEISKLLFSSFNNNLPNINSEDMVRLWSLELQWFNPADSNLVLSHLLHNDWLLESMNILYPNPNLELISPTLGWQPILREILKLPRFKPTNNASEKEIEKFVKIITPKKTDESENLESVESKTMSLINYVSKNSGLTSREVVRRSQRKRKALGPITLWLCVALLAREQGLDMNEIIHIIDE